MCHQACPEAIGTKVTPGTMTYVSQLAFQLGMKLVFIAVVLSEAKIESTEIFASELGRIVG